MAAVGYAKFTGKLGVCFSTAAPGAVHLINGLLDAKVEQAPVLAITGMTYHDLIGTSYLQDVNTDYLFNDIALYNQRIMGPQHVINVVDYACRTALTQPRSQPPRRSRSTTRRARGSGSRYMRNVPGHTSTAYRPPRAGPDPRRTWRRPPRRCRARPRWRSSPGRARAAPGANWRRSPTSSARPIIKAQLGKDCVPDD